MNKNKSHSSAAAAATFTLFAVAIFLLSSLHLSHALGSAATLAVTSAPAAVCGVVASEPTRRIACYRDGDVVAVAPDVSFSAISGGRSYFCGLRSGNYSLLCWDTLAGFRSKRLYNNGTVLFENLAVGDSQVCATAVGAGTASCWRTNAAFELPSGSDQFSSISSGSGFSCGILKGSNKVRCWGIESVAKNTESEFRNMSMASLVAGESHVCGLNSSGFLVCRGSNGFGQIDVPEGGALEFSGLALGAEHSCAIRRSNGSVVCWGGRGLFSVNVTKGVSFEVIVSGSNFTCGLTTNNFSVICWGPGWANANGSYSGSGFEIPLPPILPGPCVQSSCSECGIYPQSESLCSGFGNICKPTPCWPQMQAPGPPQVAPPSPPASRSRALTKGLLAFAIVGSVGGVAGACTVIYFLWTGVCFGKKKIHNSVQPTITRGGSLNGGAGSNNGNSPPSRSSTIRRQGSRIMRRQRKHLPPHHERINYGALFCLHLYFGRRGRHRHEQLIWSRVDKEATRSLPSLYCKFSKRVKENAGKSVNKDWLEHENSMLKDIADFYDGCDSE
ncbi:putative serine/threonine-protein kinase protein CCR3 [Spatholobus suberectus]|nr:putative serine/threonine-protein kinase protein CCR3 [Spatholobus suberectus]